MERPPIYRENGRVFDNCELVKLRLYIGNWNFAQCSLWFNQIPDPFYTWYWWMLIWLSSSNIPISLFLASCSITNAYLNLIGQSLFPIRIVKHQNIYAEFYILLESFVAFQVHLRKSIQAMLVKSTIQRENYRKSSTYFTEAN